MASTVTIKQRVSLENRGRTLRVSQTQNGQTRSQEITLKEPVRNLKQLHTITDLAGNWPKTEISAPADVIITSGEDVE